MSQNIETLVEQLYDPKTRRAARLQLIEEGAAEALIGCLTATNESVVWAAVASLSKLKAQEAVEPLIELLERDVLVLDVADALAHITGASYGPSAAAWRAWFTKTNGKAQTVDLTGCVKDSADLLGTEVTKHGSGLQMILPVKDDREQTVIIREANSGDEQLVVLYTICGPADPKYYETLLKKNTSLVAGSFAIREVHGEPKFVMVETMLVESVTATTLASRIESLASVADRIESKLTGDDKW